MVNRKSSWLYAGILLAGSISTDGRVQRGATDYEGCGQALSELQEASSAASRKSKDVIEAMRVVEEAKGRIRKSCESPSLPSTCRTAQADLSDAESGLEREQFSFRDAYREVAGRVDSFHIACSPPGTVPAIPGVSEANLEACTMLRSFRNPPMGLIPKLNSDCRALGLSETECKICLGANYRQQGGGG